MGLENLSSDKFAGDADTAGLTTTVNSLTSVKAGSILTYFTGPSTVLGLS